MPWPLSVSSHFPDIKTFKSLVKVASSEPSANVAWGAIAWAVFESDRVVAEWGVDRANLVERFGNLRKAVVMVSDNVVMCVCQDILLSHGNLLMRERVRRVVKYVLVLHRIAPDSQGSSLLPSCGSCSFPVPHISLSTVPHCSAWTFG